MKYILVLIYLLISTHANSKVCHQGTAYFFVNGVGFNTSGVTSNVQKTTKVVGNLGQHDSIDFSFRIESGLLKDVLIALEQLIDQSGVVLSARDLMLDLLSGKDKLYEVNEVERLTIEEALKVALTTSNDQIRYKTIVKQLDSYRKKMEYGRKVVLIAHSQGTLYSNEVLKLLNETEKSSVKTVYVAPAASYLQDGSGRYILNSIDEIITPLPNSLDSNAGPEELPFFNHSYEGYIDAFEATIKSLVDSARHDAYFPLQDDCDNDEDGVVNKVDECPYSPKDDIVDTTGCSIDQDGDKIIDDFDHCPTAGGEVDSIGCPVGVGWFCKADIYVTRYDSISSGTTYTSKSQISSNGYSFGIPGAESKFYSISEAAAGLESMRQQVVSTFDWRYKRVFGLFEDGSMSRSEPCDFYSCDQAIEEVHRILENTKTPYTIQTSNYFVSHDYDLNSRQCSYSTSFEFYPVP